MSSFLDIARRCVSTIFGLTLEKVGNRFAGIPFHNQLNDLPFPTRSMLAIHVERLEKSLGYFCREERPPSRKRLNCRD